MSEKMINLNSLILQENKKWGFTLLYSKVTATKNREKREDVYLSYFQSVP